MTAVLCWCPGCTPRNQQALKQDRRVSEFADREGGRFAEHIGLRYGLATFKSVLAALARTTTPELTKRQENGPVTHITGQGGTDNDAFSARLVSQAVGAVTGEPPGPDLTRFPMIVVGQDAIGGQQLPAYDSPEGQKIRRASQRQAPVRMTGQT